MYTPESTSAETKSSLRDKHGLFNKKSASFDKKFDFSRPLADIEEDLDSVEVGSFREEALKEKCGVFGVISNGDWPTSLDVAHIICLGLVGLQHRGQESAGIVTCKYKTEPFSVSRSEGLVSSAFNEISMMSLKGNLGIGHTRYSTSGGSGSIQLAQPFVIHTKYGTIAVAHNGELVNSSNLRETLLSHGVGLTTGGDSELITQCLSQMPPEEFRFRKEKFNKNNNNSNKQHVKGTHQIGANDKSSSDSEVMDSESLEQQSGNHQRCSGFRRNSTGTSSKDSIWKPDWKCELSVEEDDITSRVLYLMSLTPLSYSLVIMYNECLYAVRDPFGNRPLTIGMLAPPPSASEVGSSPFYPFDHFYNCFVEGWCISSESCPFPSVHASLMRDVDPGEIIKFERNKPPKTLAIMPRPNITQPPAFCVFEYVYFARPDSIMERQTVYAVRKRCGERLARESPAVKPGADKSNFIVSPVPESSIPAALGFSQESGIPYVEVFCKNRYVGRTFIQPSTRLRRLSVAKKFGPLTENLRGKSIVLIDDSIVRGTTINKLVCLLRDAGAKEVHIRIASPPLHYPCYMGINIPTREELIANYLSPDALTVRLGAASLAHLSVEGLLESVQSGIRKMIQADLKRLPTPKLGHNDRGLRAADDRDRASGLASNGTMVPNNGNELIGPNDRLELEPEPKLKPKLKPKPEEARNGTNLNCVNSPNSNMDEPKTPIVDIEAQIDKNVGHCDACLTGNYPVKLERCNFA